MCGVVRVADGPADTAAAETSWPFAFAHSRIFASSSELPRFAVEPPLVRFWLAVRELTFRLSSSPFGGWRHVPAPCLLVVRTRRRPVPRGASRRSCGVT